MAATLLIFPTCGTCFMEFGNDHARMQHITSLGHHLPNHECHKCFFAFTSHHALVDHLNAQGHWPYKCGFCDRFFHAKKSLQEHEVGHHYYCQSCDRLFHSHNNIKMHFNSGIHSALDLRCTSCEQAYPNATALSHHMESGACPGAPFMNRNHIYHMVLAKDPYQLISKPWNGTFPQLATASAWNGLAFECYLCRRPFGRLQALNQHLDSSVHRPNLYHCPLTQDCGREFASLAAVMNHLESETCGYTKFENVQRTIQSLFTTDDIISFNAW
ncbi:hypothetical protein F5B19DRAFT_497961 [Rostrohypoxylon terebratum]|nr:hypothetical protein F5B19DRAFT_497961 [Rostrohypoxylon terebratum]